uniref:J domain-containing protein n=1 Tax=Drosophila melanogaster TaxID=7227 RepID=Q8I079_DROME|nr:uncharacterized protein Dmel_CG32640 [Drosophila melanogaster]NP_727675.1 uncharacterized protein Dmel_CG32641 [Drosophila melanogaster]AAN09649.1 uncharacterized protein Dmel_CG32640 [Drosophila melanogaster]AAN09650.1 uncharacterized protein Dmel_CG32641 [Drosophila melanogaster]|eukprot:NP_727674.1 uncharacterized protein Dmel_CG32640 [Drosophila melanogaster]
MEEDYYMILGVDHNATDEEIRRAYKRMALIYHPDKNKHPRTTAQFRKINEAFNVLSDASARRKYDASVMLSRRAHTTNNSHNSGGYQPNGSYEREMKTSDTFSTVCAVGGVLVGLFLGFGAFKALSGSNNNH